MEQKRSFQCLQGDEPNFLETHLTVVGIFQLKSKMHACLTDTGMPNLDIVQQFKVFNRR